LKNKKYKSLYKKKGGMGETVHKRGEGGRGKGTQEREEEGEGKAAINNIQE